MQTPQNPFPWDRSRSGCANLAQRNLAFLLDRWTAKGRPPWIDTKLDVATGQDFAGPTTAGTIHCPEVVYGWIQGRALEALAGHLLWLDGLDGPPNPARPDLRAVLVACLETVGASVEACRAANQGRLAFMMEATSGRPLGLDAAGRLCPLPQPSAPPGFTDLFASKGLAMAGYALGNPAWVTAGTDWFRNTVAAIFAGEFVSDQQPMDPKNPVRHLPGRISHGPFMIAIGGAAALLETTGDPEWWDTGLALLQHVVAKHVNQGQFAGLEPGDLVEFITPAGLPYDSDGAVLCDPGHALEFVGLAGKLLRAGRRACGPGAAVAATVTALGPVLRDVFRSAHALGFDPAAGGIRKLVDLRTRGPVNTDMPWWSLPEAMRAAACLADLYPEACGSAMEEILGASWNAFRRYLSPAAGWLAVQTRDASGAVVRVIPACPDVDPCYHTGLSLIDVWRSRPAE